MLREWQSERPRAIRGKLRRSSTRRHFSTRPGSSAVVGVRPRRERCSRRATLRACLLHPGRRRQAVGAVEERQRGGRRDARPRRLFRRRLSGRPAGADGQRDGHHAQHDPARRQAADGPAAAQAARHVGPVHLAHARRATSGSRKTWSISCSTRARSGWPARCCCWRATASRTSRRARCRRCRRRRWRRLSARRGRA